MSARLHVGFEATAACRRVRTGIARYAHHLMAALVETAEPRAERFSAYVKLSRAWKRGCRPEPVAGLRWRYYADSLPLPLTGPHLMHGLEMVLPRAYRGPRIATLHDLFGLVDEGLLGAGARERNKARYAAVAEGCDHVIAVSQSTKADFLHYFPAFPAERVHVVPLGVDPRFAPRSEAEHQEVLQRHGLEEPFLLYVGDLTPRKNLLRLLEAFSRSEASQEHMLVIVGAREDGAGELAQALAKSRSRGRVRVLGWIADEDLLRLYSAASALLFPTLYEGFGLPILEAFASGTPALGSDRGAVPEVAAGHATLVDPTQVDSIVEGIEAVVRTDRDAAEAARCHARAFTWQRCAEQTRVVYRAAID